MSKSIKDWADKINWKQRVKAVCKPCWEIKYCPYGPLIESFPLKEKNDDKSCRIFGHDCPVFFVAEPFTETRELRNISRNISRTTQFKVLKRDNQICSECGKSILDDDMEFDHIIPWSKGGSSDDYNIRTLCSDCNKSKGNNFEFDYLINSVVDHMNRQHDDDLLEFLLCLMAYGHNFKNENEVFPKAQDIANEYSKGKVTDFEQQAEELINDFDTFFNYSNSVDIPKIQFKALRKRWGFKDGKVYFLKEISEEFHLSMKQLVQNEIKIIEKHGYVIKRDKKLLKKWEYL